MRLGYLGPAGSFSWEAAQKYAEKLNETVQEVAFKDIDAIFAAVAAGEIEAGMVPLENSLEGSVNITLDLLAHEYDLQVTGEVVLPVHHCLLVRPGTKIEEIKTIYSHPQALAQCRRTLKALFPEVCRRETGSTAEAVRLVASGEEGAAALGSRKAAELYGLTVLREGMQDEEKNWTRFMVIGREGRPVRPEKSRTLLVLSFPDRPGGLYEILKIFALRRINLTKIESRPARKGLGDYIFFLEMEGAPAISTVAEALQELKERTTWLKILGTYEKWEE